MTLPSFFSFSVKPFLMSEIIDESIYEKSSWAHLMLVVILTQGELSNSATHLMMAN